MKTLEKASENISVFILELKNNFEVEKFLNSIWIFENSIISIIKNDWKAPLIIEIDWARFVLSREIAKKINTSCILENQSKIFEWNQTKQREIILKVLKSEKNHFTFEEILQKVQKKDKKIWQITIYRTLKTLSWKWLLETIEMPDWNKKFENKKGHHDHLICEKCWEIYEFHSEKIEKMQKEIAEKYWVKLEKHTLNLIWKECKKCEKK